jgi:glycine oxidase
MAGQAAGDVVVVGGGVIGLGIAWRAAQAGMAVTVVDPAPGRGASWAGAGMLAPVTEVHYGEQALLRLNLAAADRWPAFAAELEQAAGARIGYRRCGTLTVARDADDNAALEELYRFQLRCGLEVERLRSRDCRRLEPGLAPSVRGGVLAPGDHQVDNRAMAGALATACERAGVRLLAGRVAELAVDGDRVTGVVLAGGAAPVSGGTAAAAGPAQAAGGRLAAGTVVLAAGCWSRELGGLAAELLPPVRPVKGQLLHLRGPAADPLCRRNLRGLEVYVVPRADGRVVVGATVEEQGFDTRVTAGAVHDLLRAAFELLPDVAELELTETVAGLRPGSPDNAPLIGRAGVDGLVVATGHYRNGILLAPVTAEAVAELLATGRVPAVIAPFAPGRRDAGELGGSAAATVRSAT